jgi:hypothetical protein
MVIEGGKRRLTSEISYRRIVHVLGRTQGIKTLVAHLQQFSVGDSANALISRIGETSLRASVRDFVVNSRINIY